MSSRDYLCSLWMKEKKTTSILHAVFSAFQVPLISPDFPSQEMYFCYVLLIQLFIIYTSVHHTEVFADLLSASSFTSELPLVWLFLFGPEEFNKATLQQYETGTTPSLLQLKVWTVVKTKAHHQLPSDVTIFSMLFSAHLLYNSLYCLLFFSSSNYNLNCYHLFHRLY